MRVVLATVIRNFIVTPHENTPRSAMYDNEENFFVVSFTYSAYLGPKFNIWSRLPKV